MRASTAVGITIVGIVIIFVCIIGFSIITTGENIPDNINIEDDIEYKIITIDSCEYIKFNDYYYSSEDKIIHKGNCKYCQERLEKTLKSIK